MGGLIRFCIIFQLVLLFLDVIFCHTEHPLLLLVSFDGFRWDYLMKAKLANHHTPNFDSLIQNGVTLDKPGLLNSFITQTFPNHYTLVTGMYEENHGVVANKMYDPTVNKSFSISKKSDVQDAFWFNNGSTDHSEIYKGPQPIWNRNQMFGKGPSRRRSGVMFWPGSEAAVGGDHPAHCEHYDKTLPNKTRIDNVVGWFATEEKPINLGLLYFSEPDHTGHLLGPDDPRILILIEELDKLVGYLIDKLKEVHLFEKMNIIITSDHGMTQIKEIIHVTLDPNLFDVINGEFEPIWSIMPKKGKEEQVFETLKKLKHVHVYKKEDIPNTYHYKHNNRILPILVETEEGYMLCLNKNNCSIGGGIHGYNNSLNSMHPFFIAHGPAFKKNYTGKPFRNVDIYPLMCHILEIEPPNYIDGTISNVRHILFSNDFVFEVTAITFLLSVAFTALVGGICCISACRIYHIKIRQLKKRHIIVQMEQVSIDGRKPLLNSDEDEFS